MLLAAYAASVTAHWKSLFDRAMEHIDGLAIDLHNSREETAALRAELERSNNEIVGLRDEATALRTLHMKTGAERHKQWQRAEKAEAENERLQAQLAEFKDFQYEGWREQIEERNAQLAQAREALEHAKGQMEQVMRCFNIKYNLEEKVIPALSSTASSSAWLAQQRSEAAAKALSETLHTWRPHLPIEVQVWLSDSSTADALAGEKPPTPPEAVTK
jgi:chromosome segregation ATPase